MADFPTDPGFCHAVRAIATTLMPAGFDVSPHAPNTYEALLLAKAQTGRLCVTNAPATEHVFDSIETFHAWRAWHDWTHIALGQPFTLEGECAVVHAQEAMVAARFGEQAMLRWLPYMEQQIIADNFGDDAICGGPQA
jgi:hypothetical protein